MEKSTAIRRINRIGRVGQIVVALWLVACLFSALFFSLIVVDLADPTDYFVQDAMEDDMDWADVFNDFDYFGSYNNTLGVTIKENVQQNAGDIQEDSIRSLLLFSLGIWVEMAASLVSTVFAWKLCGALRHCPSPFDGSVIRSMRHFAFSLLPWIVIHSLSGLLMHSFLGGEFIFGIDVNMLCLVLFILALTYIFQYGAVLQQESDETL